MNDVIPSGRTASDTDHQSLGEAGNLSLDRLSNDVEIIHAARMSLQAGLAASISHQVNDSLSAIILDGETSLALLSRDDLEVERIKTVTRRMMSAARRASDNVRRIRALDGRDGGERALVDLNSIASEVAAIVRGILDTERVSFSTAFSDTLPLVFGDPVHLQQVVLNLLVNSMQAISAQRGDPRKIELVTQHRDDNTVTVTVKDTGRTVFAEGNYGPSDWFPAAARDGARSGLAVCRLIAITHGGSFTEHDLPDGGTESVLTLPLASDGPAVTAPHRNGDAIKG